MARNILEIKYENKLDLVSTQKAIKLVKDIFQKELVKQLNLTRVSAPMFVFGKSGLNDNLSGVEKPVCFYCNSLQETIEVVHSLAKWKRVALSDYNFDMYQGLYTDMNAIRKDENLDFYHSIYVDQWDWEMIISKEDRKLSFLKKIVRKIYRSILKLEEKINSYYPTLNKVLPKDIYFISTTELEKRYPSLDSKQREDAICREFKAVFLYQIGYNLKSGKPHDIRASDYDDWKLNGDLLVYYDLYDMAFELSSMGIRVDEKSLLKQLKYAHEEHKKDNSYCKKIIEGKLPLTIGGGIGQSRLCMFMLKKAHIGEVQASIWKDEEKQLLKEKGINLL